MELKYPQGVRDRMDNGDNGFAKVIDGARSLPCLPTRYSKHIVIHHPDLQKSGLEIVKLKDT